MGQLTQQVIFFNDAAGVILPGSRHFFYEAGTTTPQTVYSNKELTTPIVQPVLADANGILEQIWLQPLPYRWVGEDASSVQLFDRDDVNFAENVINTSSSFVFSTVGNMVLGVSIGGASIDLQDGQSASTQGSVTAKDGLGADYIIEAVDPGGSVALNNGRFATELDNFQSSGDVDTKISDHNTAVGGTHADIRTEIDSDIEDHDDLAINNVHTLLMSGHNADGSAHATNIDGRISTHNVNGSSHTDIRDLTAGKTSTIRFNMDGTTGLVEPLSSFVGAPVPTGSKLGTGQYQISWSPNILGPGLSVLTVGSALLFTSVRFAPSAGAQTTNVIDVRDPSNVFTDNEIHVIVMVNNVL